MAVAPETETAAGTSLAAPSARNRNVADVTVVGSTGSLKVATTSVPTTEPVASAAGALRPRGRLIAPSSVAVPDGVTELARDHEDWVAERAGSVSPPVPIRVGRR